MDNFTLLKVVLFPFLDPVLMQGDVLQAVGREQDCIDMYKTLENTHPNPQIKKQAANLRFIMEAPKLRLGPDERVSIPVIETSDRFA